MLRRASQAGPCPAAVARTVRMAANEVQLRGYRAGSVAGTAAGCNLVVCAGEIVLELLPGVAASAHSETDSQRDGGLLQSIIRYLGGWVKASGARSLRLEEPRRLLHLIRTRC